MATHCHNKISLAPFLCLMVFLLQLMIRKQAFYGKNAKKDLESVNFLGSHTIFHLLSKHKICLTWMMILALMKFFCSEESPKQQCTRA